MRKKKGRDAGKSASSGSDFDVETADAYRVVDEIVSLRATLAAAEKSPFSAASKAPAALRRLLEIIENLNLRMADLES